MHEDAGTEVISSATRGAGKATSKCTDSIQTGTRTCTRSEREAKRKRTAPQVAEAEPEPKNGDYIDWTSAGNGDYIDWTITPEAVTLGTVGTPEVVVLSTKTVATPTDKKRQVNFLLRRRVCRRDQSISYLARWVGLHRKHDSWVSAEALNPQKVRDYKIWYRAKLHHQAQ